MSKKSIISQVTLGHENNQEGIYIASENSLRKNYGDAISFNDNESEYYKNGPSQQHRQKLEITTNYKKILKVAHNYKPQEFMRNFYRMYFLHWALFVAIALIASFVLSKNYTSLYSMLGQIPLFLDILQPCTKGIISTNSRLIASL